MQGFKDSILSQIQGWISKPKTKEEEATELRRLIMGQAFKKELTPEDKDKMLGFKLQCTCQKDPNFKFGCKNAISWFMNKTLITKIQKRIQNE